MMFWYVGRALQVIALVQVAAALLIGLRTQDATFELKLLLLGALEFMLGQFIVARVGRSE